MMLLKLDIDAGVKPLTVPQLVTRLARAGKTVIWLSQRRSPGGKGWHIVLEVSPAPRSAMEVVALQAVLGSDVWREACNVKRARALWKAPKFMRDRWNVLYRRGA